MEVPALVEVPLASALTEPADEFIALTPGLLGTSEPAGPGTEPATGAELLAPSLLLAPVLLALPLSLTLPLAPPDAPTPAPADPPPDPWAKAFDPNVAIASERIAPRTIAGIFFFIATTP
jgi:hypothetical protein